MNMLTTTLILLVVILTIYLVFKNTNSIENFQTFENIESTIDLSDSCPIKIMKCIKECDNRIKIVYKFVNSNKKYTEFFNNIDEFNNYWEKLTSNHKSFEKCQKFEPVSKCENKNCQYHSVNKYNLVKHLDRLIKNGQINSNDIDKILLKYDNQKLDHPNTNNINLLINKINKLEQIINKYYRTTHKICSNYPNHFTCSKKHNKYIPMDYRNQIHQLDKYRNDLKNMIKKSKINDNNQIMVQLPLTLVNNK